MSAQNQFLIELKKNLPLEVMHALSSKITSPHPVVHYCHSGHPGWIELVVANEVPPKLDLTPGQISWHDKYWQAGGTCYIFLKILKTRRVYIWPGRFAKDLVKDGGCYNVKPMLDVRMHEKGWGELYEIFSLAEFDGSVV